MSGLDCTPWPNRQRRIFVVELRETWKGCVWTMTCLAEQQNTLAAAKIPRLTDMQNKTMLIEIVSTLTARGLLLNYDQDVKGSDLEPKKFVIIQHDRKCSLFECAQECWLNPLCRAFSYDSKV